MNEWIGQSCQITIKKGNNYLFFTAKQIMAITDSHITFIDKFNETYTFKKDMIEEIQAIKVKR